MTNVELQVEDYYRVIAILNAPCKLVSKLSMQHSAAYASRLNWGPRRQTCKVPNPSFTGYLAHGWVLLILGKKNFFDRRPREKTDFPIFRPNFDILKNRPILLIFIPKYFMVILSITTKFELSSISRLRVGAIWKFVIFPGKSSKMTKSVLSKLSTESTYWAHI